jgi:hypothetical protein
MLRWMEKPSPKGPSAKAEPEDRVRFSLVCSFDRKEGTDAFKRVVLQLKEGDVIAYRMPKDEARLAVLKGQLNKIGYRVYKYGHLGIVVSDLSITNVPFIFSSVGFKGPNCDDTFDTLLKHDWDVYRLDKWSRVDTNRFHRFVTYAVERAGKWYGYDFSGVLGLWNSKLTPETLEEVGHDYICSTIVVAALYYSGVELDAVRRKGIADVLTPRQVVDGGGRIIPLPDAEISAEKVD